MDIHNAAEAEELRAASADVAEVPTEVPERSEEDLAMGTPGKALNLFSREHPLRRACLYILNAWWFSGLILIAILVNTFFIANEGTKNKALQDAEAIAEYLFTVIFTLELAIKVIALGFVQDRGAYLRDGWNVLDFILVIAAYVQRLPGVANITFLRVLRVLRTLRSVNKVKGMKIIINSLLVSLKSLWQTLLLLGFAFVVFSLLGVQLWLGSFHNRCYEVSVDTFEMTTRLQIPMDELGEDRMCALGSTGRQCPDGSVCLEASEAPYYGFVNFDHMGWALLTLFNAMTGDGWSGVQYWTQENSWEGWWLYWVFFMISMNFVGMNMVLAVIVDKFSEQKEAALEQGKQYVEIVTNEEVSGVAEGTISHPVRRFWLGIVARFDAFVGKDRQLPTNIVSRIFQKICLNGVFETLIMLLIIVNTVFLAMDNVNQSAEQAAFLEGANVFFTIAFALEMAFKMIAMGFFLYLSDRMNVFDAVIVVASLVELAMPGSGSSASIAFRVLRCVRIFKLARNWKAMQRVLKQIIGNIASIFYLTLIMLLFTFIYAIIGRQLFYDFENDEDLLQFDANQVDRSNFKNLLYAMLTSFQVLTGDAWTLVYYAGLRVAPIEASVYFLSWIIFGNFILLNLFVAILLEGIAIDDDEEEGGAAGDDDVVGGSGADGAVAGGSGSFGDRMYAALSDNALTRFYYWFFELEPDATSPDGTSSAKANDTVFELAQQVSKSGVKFSVKQTNTMTDRRIERLQGRSLGIFPADSSFRRACAQVANADWFEYFMLVIILLSCVTLAIDNPSLDPDSALKITLSTFDYVFLALFVAESSIKAIAYGFIRNSDAYLRDGWDQLDFFVVVLTIATIPFENIPGGGAVRAVRAIRPLRILGRFENTKVVIGALVQSVKASINVFLVTSIFWIIFAILGVQLFGGRFDSCNDGDVANVTECVGTYTSRETEQIAMYPYAFEVIETGVEREWSTPDQNFDSFGSAILSLFQACLMAGWVDIMYMGMDVTEIGQQPEEDNAAQNSMFFVAWVIVGNFFALNVFLAAIIDQYDQLRKKMDGSLFLTKEQQQASNLSKIAFRARPDRPRPIPHDPLRRKIDALVHSDYFERFITGCIFTNVFVLALEHYKQEDGWTQFIDISNLVFLVIFAIEAVLKLIALYPYRYFSDGWNKFDFSLVTAGIITSFFEARVSGLRVLRLLRVLRVVKSLRELLRTLVSVLPKAWNVSLVLFTFFYIYAVLGVQLMANLPDGDGISDNANFRNFFSALDTLFRILTGDDFPDIMFDSMNAQDGCDSSLGECGMPGYAFYYITFLVLQTFILLNLFVGVILDSFGASQALEAEALHLDEWQRFGKLWARLDPDGTDRIPARKCLTLLTALGPPLWVKPEDGVRGVLLAMQIMDIRLTTENEVPFQWLLRGLTHRVCDVPLDSSDLKVLGDAFISEFTLADWYVVSVMEKNFLRSHKKVGKKEMVARMQAAERDRQKRLAGEHVPARRERGKVAWYNEAKGLGMLERTDGQQIFVHATNIADADLKSLKEGQKVEFEPVLVHTEETGKQIHARNVTVVRKKAKKTVTELD
jgi:cold shock CspA family protein